MAKGKLNPINRNNKFYSEKDYQYELSLIDEYLEEYLNHTVIIYQVNHLKTNVDDTYVDADIIRYKPPVELPCLFEIKESSLKTYDTENGSMAYAVSGNLMVYVPVFMLEKYKCDITRGDYIGVQIDTDRVSYFKVVDDGRVNTANTNYIGAYKTSWRTIEATSVNEEEFSGK